MHNTIVCHPLICAQPTSEQQSASSGQFPTVYTLRYTNFPGRGNNHFVPRCEESKDSKSYSLATGMSLIGKIAYSLFYGSKMRERSCPKPLPQCVIGEAVVIWLNSSGQCRGESGVEMIQILWKGIAQCAQRCCSASFHFSFCSAHQLVMISETACFPNCELLPCQPATCPCIAKLSSKGIEDAIGKARDGFSCLSPSSLKSQLLPMNKVRAPLAARHRQDTNVLSEHGSENVKKVPNLSLQCPKSNDGWWETSCKSPLKGMGVSLMKIVTAPWMIPNLFSA